MVLLASAALTAALAVDEPWPRCTTCFWNHQPETLRADLLAHYESLAPADALLSAERDLFVARVRGDHALLCVARERFAEIAARAARAERETSPQRRALAAETAALLAESCGADAEAAWRDAARAARALGETWRADLYDRAARGRAKPRFGEPPPWPTLRAPESATAAVIGESRIVVTSASRLGMQIERVARDWLSAQFAHDAVSAPLAPESVVDWHEGHQARVMAIHSGAAIVPLGRALLAERDGRYYGADERGVFRFEVLPDKTQYPTTRHGHGLALLADTHGYSAIAEQAIREDIDVAIACGDSRGKMHAALHLAARGIDAYFPCDRFVGLVLGYEGPGTLIGSAPVRLESDGTAIIGDQPVTIWRGERVIAQDAPDDGDMRYCDAPRRYFEALARAFPLDVDIVRVDDVGQADRVVARALSTGARVIGVRVMSDDDATPVLRWLDASPKHRAVLFHSAPYPAGRRVYERFPSQTTFGDPRPRFVTRTR